MQKVVSSSHWLGANARLDLAKIVNKSLLSQGLTTFNAHFNDFSETAIRLMASRIFSSLVA